MNTKLPERTATSTPGARSATRLARSAARLTALGAAVVTFSAFASTSCQGEEPRGPTRPGEDQLGSLQLSASLPSGFQENLVITGRTAPVALRFTPQAQSGALSAFLAEKSGLVFAYQNLATQSNPTQVIDLRPAVHDYWDRGLLGIAVHPNYPATSQIFVLYAHDAFANGTSPRWGDTCPNPPGDTADGCVVYGRLSRIDIDPTTLVGTEVPLIQANWCQQYPSHSIGDMRFGADGYLYVSAGDGASFTFNDVGQDGSPVNPCGDPGTVTNFNTSEGGRLRSQDVLTNSDPIGYGGSVLRLDVSGGSVSAPPDNPLVGKGTTADDYIVATGLRNPYRFTIRPGTNELWIADVGQDAYEELNRIQDPTGTVENFGFPCYEGPTLQSYLQSNVLCTQVINNSYPAHVSPMTRVAPYYAYHHSASVVPGDGCPTGSSSVTGVAFNNHTAYPSKYDNALFFADSSRRCVWAMFAGSDGLPNPNDRGAFITGASGRVVDIQMGPDGRLYYVDFDGGAVYRVDNFSGNQPPQAALAAAPTSGAAPLFVQFDASASTDAESPTLSYLWDFDDDGTFDDGSGALASYVFEESGPQLVHVQVTDGGGLSDVASLTITVDNTPPTVTILTPSESLEWAVGDTISFSGAGNDPEQGPLPPDQLSWQVILHHCSTPEDCHAHPIQNFEGVASGSFQAPDHDYPSYLELVLSANDSAADWFDPAWQFRRTLTLNHAGLAAVSDFPVLVRLDASRIDYAATQPGGRDLRFVDAAGQLLAHEVELWNPNGVSAVWVKVPNVAAGSTDRQITMYYGNPSASVAENAAAVWSNGYVGVWHLDDLSDSTSFGHDGTNQGSTSVAGRIGNGRSFNGQSYVTVASTAALQIAGSVSIEAWAKPSSASLTGYPRIVSKKAAWDAAAGYNLEFSPSQNFITALGGGGDYLRANTTIGAEFHYYASSISGTTGSLYKNGVNVTSDSSVGAVTGSTQALNIGRDSGGTDYMSGQIDELRISNVARNANWFAVQHRSMTDAYLTFGPEQESASLGATTSVVLQPATAEVTFASEPPGLQLQVGSDLLTTPAPAQTAIENSRLSVSVVSPQVVNGVEYEFVGWSDDGDQSHLYTVDGDATLTATFTPVDTVIDLDNDGLPDDWEDQYGLDPTDPSDAAVDSDGDRLTNLQEFGNGTDPGDPDTDGDSWDDFTEITFQGDALDPDVVPDPPVVSITAPEAGLVIEGSTVQIDFTTTGIILLNDHVHLELDDGEHVTINGTSGSYIFTGLEPGSHTLVASLSSAAHQPYTHPGAAVSVSFETLAAPECGNGVVEGSEVCDTAGQSQSCDADCTAPACGDGTTNSAAGEACDTSGQSATCDADCTAAICGDGTTNSAAGEACDTSGQSATCDANCTAASCGDGTTNSAANEQCDDGNTNNVDGCSNACKLPTCSDGVQNGSETGKDCGGTCPACPPTGSMALSISVTNSWPTGYCAALNVKNNGTQASTNWSAVINTNGTTLYTTWNGTFSANSGQLTVTPISWNKVVQPGATDTSIGFCANRPSGSAVALPVSITGTY